VWVEDKFFSRQESNHVYTVRVHQFNNWLNVFFVFYVTTSHQLHSFTASCLKVQLNNFFSAWLRKRGTSRKTEGLRCHTWDQTDTKRAFWLLKNDVYCLPFMNLQLININATDNRVCRIFPRGLKDAQRLAATKFIHLNTSARPCYKNVVNKLCSI
jgi:hypothetical protein